MNIFNRDPDRKKELKHYLVYWLIMAAIFVAVLYLAYSWYVNNLMS